MNDFSFYIAASYVAGGIVLTGLLVLSLSSYYAVKRKLALHMSLRNDA